MLAPQRKGWFLPPVVAGASRNGPGPSRAGNYVDAVAGEAKGGEALVGDGIRQPEVLPLPFCADGEDGNEVEVWSRFREAGFLDEAVLHWRDREALAQRISELEKELYQYQYHMGLLLIEKKNMTDKYEKLRQEMSEEVEIKKHLQAAHLLSISEFEKQEENMSMALGLQRQSIVNLEKVLNEMHAQTTEVKLEYLKKFSEVYKHEVIAEGKSCGVKGKLRSLDARLAEISRRSAEIDRRLQEVEARELILHKESSSFITEKVTSEKDVAQQKQDLQAWEKELRDNQKKLAEWHSLLNEREMEAHWRDNSFKKKEKQLEEAWKTLEISQDSIKLKEEDICERLRAFDAKEKEVLVKQGILEKKEKELLTIEEQLSNRERVDIHKTMDYHNSILESQRKQFELETEKERRDVDDHMKGRIDVMAHKKTLLENREREISKKEQDLERDVGDLKHREEENGMVLNELEETFRNEKEKIEDKKEWQLVGEKRSSVEERLKQNSDKKENLDWGCAAHFQMDREGSSSNTIMNKPSHQKIDASEVFNSENAHLADLDVCIMQRNQEQVNRTLQEEDIDVDCNMRNATINTCIILNNLDESKILDMREQEYQLKKGKTKVLGNNNDVDPTAPIIKRKNNKVHVDEPSNESNFFLGPELKSCRNCGFKDGEDEILSVESAEVSKHGICPGSAKPEACLLCMQRCSRLLEFSTDKRAAEHSDKSDCLDDETFEHEDNLGPRLLLGEVNTSECVHSANGTKCNTGPERLNQAENAAKDSSEIPDNSTNILKFNDSLNDIEQLTLHCDGDLVDRDACSVPPGLGSVPLQLKQKQFDHGGRRTSIFIKKSRSVNALIADNNVEVISQSKHDEGSTYKETQRIWTCLDEGYGYDGVQEAVRCLSHQQGMTSAGPGEYAEGHSQDISQLRNIQEMEISPRTEILGLKRYNYRHSTIFRVCQALAFRKRKKTEEELEQSLENKVLKIVGHDGEGAQRHTSADESEIFLRNLGPNACSR